MTVEIAGKTLFDVDIADEATEIRGALTAAFASFNFTPIPYGVGLVHLPLPPAIRFRRARARLYALIIV